MAPSLRRHSHQLTGDQSQLGASVTSSSVKIGDRPGQGLLGHEAVRPGVVAYAIKEADDPDYLGPGFVELAGDSFLYGGEAIRRLDSVAEEVGSAVGHVDRGRAGLAACQSTISDTALRCHRPLPG
jgi:hypothetical protein